LYISEAEAVAHDAGSYDTLEAICNLRAAAAPHRSLVSSSDPPPSLNRPETKYQVHHGPITPKKLLASLATRWTSASVPFQRRLP
jgi:hypothetical protein